jgi:hypothetical protein
MKAAFILGLTIEGRARLACGFGRRARTIVGQISLTGFWRDAEYGNRDGCAPFLDGLSNRNETCRSVALPGRSNERMATHFRQSPIRN